MQSVRLAVLLLLGAVAAASAETITGYIYCDNQFQFYFNGKLIAADPLDFTPHNAVKVSFEYDGTSPKTYAILCTDYATSSGYEYTQTARPQLGDGALLASFSDGTVTNAAWKKYTVTYGPTDASIAAGCSATNLNACKVQDYGAPSGWYLPSFAEGSLWTNATTYTEAEAGWGRAPSWSNGACCTSTSPLTMADLGCSVNSTGKAVVVTQDECLDPRKVLQPTMATSGAKFIWGTDLDRDNKVLFRFTAPGSKPSSQPPPTPVTSCKSDVSGKVYARGKTETQKGYRYQTSSPSRPCKLITRTRRCNTNGWGQWSSLPKLPLYSKCT